MFNGDRGRKFAARLKAGWPYLLAATVVASLIVITISWGLHEQSKYQQTAANSTALYASNADHRIRDTCLTPAVENQEECARQARDTAYQQQNDANDLSAQRIMALWTFIMGAAAVAGVWLSVVGVWLIFVTFRETQKANELLARGLKPNLKFNWANFAIQENENFRPWTKTRIENLGHTTAKRVKIVLNYRIDLDPPIEGRLFPHDTCREFEVSDQPFPFKAFGDAIPKEAMARMAAADKPFVRISGSYSFDHEFGRAGPIAISLDGQLTTEEQGFRAHINVAETEKQDKTA